MKLIKLSAYLQHNAGDDLMVEELIGRYPNFIFYGCIPHQMKTERMKRLNYFDVDDVYANKVLGRLNHLANLLTFNARRDFLYRCIFRIIEKKCCTAVAIGGAIYRPMPNETIPERIAREKRKHATDGSLYVIGANFGPYQQSDFLYAFRNYFRTCSGVSFRDSQSYELFKEIKHVQWAPDVLFTVPELPHGDSNKVIISVINLNKRAHLVDYKDAYTDFLLDVCRYALKNGYTPVLTSFCQYEGDEEAISELMSQMNAKEIEQTEIFFYRGDTANLLTLFGNARLVIATRFHSMILAMRYSKPLFTISYELKSENVLNDTASVAWCGIDEISQITAENAFALAFSHICVKQYADAAEKQFAQLDIALQNMK